MAVRYLDQSSLLVCLLVRMAIRILTNFLQNPLNQGLTQAKELLLSHVRVPLTSQIRGIKFKDTLELRCKDCFFQRVDDRWMVLCSVFPRHKQIEKRDDKMDNWILTVLEVVGLFRRNLKLTSLILVRQDHSITGPRKARI